MDADIALIIGIVLGILAVPAIVSAFSDGRTPVMAMIVVLIAGGLLFYANNISESGYELRDVPLALFRVIGKL